LADGAMKKKQIYDYYIQHVAYVSYYSHYLGGSNVLKYTILVTVASFQH